LNDPKEQRDLYKDENHKDIKNELLRALLTWRSELTDVEYLNKNSYGGGPVATRMGSYTSTMKGTDAEEHLNKTAEKIDKLG